MAEFLAQRPEPGPDEKIVSGMTKPEEEAISPKTPMPRL